MNKNLPLESLRGIAAVAVVLFHFKFSTPLVDNPFIAHAYVMVDFFFVLSGFVIAMNYMNRIDDFGALVQFQTRRFWRLYPLHFATLMFFVLRDVRFSVSEMMQGNYAPPMLQSGYLFKLINHLFMTHALFLDHLAFVWPSWSISTEFFTYLLFATTLLLIRRRRITAYLFFIAIACTVNWKWGNGLRSSCYFGIFRCIYSFYLGALTWQLTQNHKVKYRSFIPLLSLIISVIAVMMLTKSRYELMIPLLFCVTIALVTALQEKAWLKQFLSHRFLVYLGTISYSVYLTHAIVIVIYLAVIRRYLNIPTVKDQAGHVFYNTSHLMGTIMILSGVAITIGISHLTYHFIEDRFRRGLRKKQIDQQASATSKV